MPTAARSNARAAKRPSTWLCIRGRQRERLTACSSDCTWYIGRAGSKALTLGTLGVALDRHAGLDVPAAEGDPVRGAHLLHRGKRAEPLHELGVEQRPRRRLTVLRFGEAQPEGEHAARLEAELGPGQRAVALEQEPGADHQHERERDFGHDQRRAKPAAAPALPGAARPLAE